MSNAVSGSMRKTCFKCGKQQPLTSFYKHSAMADGHLGKCKTCAKADVAAHRVANIEQVREYDRARAKRPERIKAAAEINRAWRREDARRVRCHNAVARAVAAGRLIPQPCERCGKKAGAHHESYDHALVVRWLCQEHHKARHKQMAIEGIEP